MRKRLFAVLVSLCMVLTMLPTMASAEMLAGVGGEDLTIGMSEQEQCSCVTLCTEGNINPDCPVCGAEGADLTACKGAPLMMRAAPLAAGSNTVYVGGVALAGSSDSIVYATTNESGEVITEGATADNYNIKWDGSTLTLHDATIQKELYASDLPLSNIAGAAIGVINQSGDAGLTVQLEGNNKIEGVSTGIHVRSSGGNAALNITGNGTLVVNSNYPTIQVTSIGGNAALSIENAKVTATSSYSNVVTVQSGNSENSSASLTVDGGSLTATAPSNNVSGIRFVFGSGGSGSGTPNLTVSGNATVRANGSAGGITNNSSTGVQYGTGGKETGGIVWNGKDGTVYGKVELQEDITIGEGETLTIGDGASLDMGGHTITVENGGKLEGTPTGDGTIITAPTITTADTDLPDGTVGTAYNQTLTADGTAPITWSVTDGSLPDGLNLNKDTGEISGTPTADGDFTFTVTATNDAGTNSKEFTLTVQKAEVPVDPPKPEVPSQPERPADTTPDKDDSSSYQKETSYEQTVREFWNKVKNQILSAEKGEKLNIYIGAKDEIPGDIIRALRTAGVTVTFRNLDGEQLTISPDSAPTGYRTSWSLRELGNYILTEETPEQTAENPAQPVAEETVSQETAPEDAAKPNPETGDKNLWGSVTAAGISLAVILLLSKKEK